MTTKVLIEVPAHLETAMRRYLDFVTEMEHVALAAPDGQVLQVCEQAVVQKGRPMLAQTLTQVVARRIEATEKKGRRSGGVSADDRKRTAVPDLGNS
jgi:hypothetical protein